MNILFTRQGLHVSGWGGTEMAHTIGQLSAPSCALGPDGRGTSAHRPIILQIPLLGEFRYVPRYPGAFPHQIFTHFSYHPHFPVAGPLKTEYRRENEQPSSNILLLVL